MSSPPRLLAALPCLLLTAAACDAERPTAMRLFPARSVFFARLPDAAELADRWNRGSGGQMTGDPEIAPFLQALYAKADDAYRNSDAGEATGGGLGDVLQLFQGEAAFAVVPRRGEFAGLLVLADTVNAADRAADDPLALADGKDRATALIESLKAKAAAEGDQTASETIGSVEATVFRQGDKQNEVFAIVERDGVIVMSNDRMLLESTIVKWDEAEGVEQPAATEADEPTEASPDDEDKAKRADRLRRRYAKPLAENAAFTESLRECVSERLGGGDESPPQIAVFIDPVGIFRAIAQENAGMRIALATLPILGLDGVEGAAAAMWINEGDWDTLFRGHLLLDNPRSGVLKMARLAPCDPTPGDAIPADVAGYTCGAIDFAATLNGAGQLYDRIRGDGEFDKLIAEQVEKRIGVSLDDVFERLDGRVASVLAYGETPEGEAPRVTPERALLISISDADWIEATLRETLTRVGAPVEWRSHGGVDYVEFKGFEAPEGVEESRQERRRRVRMRRTVNLRCFAVTEDQLLMTESPELLHKLIDTEAGLGERLAGHLPFRLTFSRAKRLGKNSTGGQEGRLLSYEDPGAQFRQWHTAGTSAESRERLDRLAERAPPLRWLRDAMDEGGVPSVETLMKYATPSGAALYDTPRGFRYVAFAFKIDPAE